MKLEEREDIRQFVEDKISKYLETFTQKQIDLFNRLYPGCVADENLANALNLCEIMDKQNKEGKYKFKHC